MKLKKLKGYGALLTSIGFVIIAAEKIIGSGGEKTAVLLGFGICSLIVGVLTVIRSAVLLSKPDKAEDYDNAVADERTDFVYGKAGALAFRLSLMLQGIVGAAMFFFLNKTQTGLTLFYLMCAECLIYAAAYGYINRKS